MNITANAIELNNFELMFEIKYARVYANQENGMIICELLTDYIPIDDFKEVFSEISKIVERSTFFREKVLYIVREMTQNGRKIGLQQSWHT